MADGFTAGGSTAAANTGSSSSTTHPALSTSSNKLGKNSANSTITIATTTTAAADPSLARGHDAGRSARHDPSLLPLNRPQPLRHADSPPRVLRIAVSSLPQQATVAGRPRQGQPQAEAARPTGHEPTQTRPRPRASTTTASTGAASTGAASTGAADAADAAAHAAHAQPRAAGQRERLLPKRLSTSSDESRHQSLPSSPTCRPPNSYRPPPPVRVLPIRAFRSSGSRARSVALDMSFSPRPYDGLAGDHVPDTSDEPTLRALEGRFVDDAAAARHRGPRADDTGDVFLRIASEEPAPRARDAAIPDDVQSSVSRVCRSSHRRPLSTAVATYHSASPPQLTRRLSNHQDRPRLRILDDDQATEVSPATAHRLLPRDRPASVHPGQEVHATRARSGSASLRPSLLAPRSLALQEPGADSSVYVRRRASITDGNPPVAGRSSTYRASGLVPSHGKAYSSSPLARSFDLHNRPGSEAAHGVEGTESTASTTAPSTVWDELDDLKSRIHRLELTGKLPSTSAAAVSRLSDERPPTATTTVTTISLSPKRQVGQSAADAATAGPSAKEAHHILQSALAKSRPFMSPDVYRALESAASDAMALSAMMGAPGLPGPISSGASTIGSGSTITDRQLRRKADSVCRSLTELCVALGENAAAAASGSAVAAAQPRSGQPTQMTFAQFDGPVTPTIPKSYSSLPVSRRASIAAEPGLTHSSSSPRVLSRFEERRHSLLNGTTLPTPTAAGSSSSTPNDASASRRCSLMVGRTRRAGTEEPEDGRSSSILRTRRAGTEEPDEGRRTSLLVRSRRGTAGEEGDESRFRAPSRANTDVNMLRGQGCGEYTPETKTTPPDVIVPSAASMARRRYVSTSLHSSRLAVPSGSSPAPPRRYLERSAADREAAATIRTVDEHGLRPPPLSQGISHLRASSFNARRQQNRDGMVPVASSATTAGAYR